MDDNEGGLAIGNKIYHIDTFLQNQIATFFELHLSTLLNNNNHDNHGIMARLGRTDYHVLSSEINICMYVCMYVLRRPSVALQKLTACCRAIQYATSLLPGADLTCVIGQALFKEVCLNSLSVSVSVYTNVVL